MSETKHCRKRLSKYCTGDGLDIGYGGDPIVPSAITIDLPVPYTNVGNHPQNLHGDARNLIWFRDNVLDYVYCLHPSTKIWTKNKIKPIYLIKSGDSVYSHNGEYRIVKEIHKKKYNGNLIKITTFSNGLELKGTPEHKIFIYRNNVKILLPLSEINSDDYIIVPFTNKIKNIKNIDVLKILPNKPGIYSKVITLRKQGFKIDEISKKTGLPRTTVWQWYTNRKTPYNIYKECNNKIISDGNSKPIPRFISLNKDFLRLIGYYISDGHASKNNVAFYFGSNEKEYYDDVINLMGNIFNISPINDKQRKNIIFIRFCSKIAANIFRFFGGLPHNKKINNLLMFLPLKKQLSLLNGLIRGDGTVSKNSSTASYSTSNLYLAWQVRELFSRQGWTSGIHHTKQKVEFDGRKIKSNQYNVYINGKEVNIIRKLTEKGTPPKGCKHKNRKNFRKIINNELLIKIKDTNKIKYNGYVYDLTINGNNNYEHTYVASGILSHNSSHLLEDFTEKELQSILKEWFRVLKPGGHLIIYCPDEQIYRSVTPLEIYNQNHKIENFSLKYLKDLLDKWFRGEYTIIHENPHVESYSFEIVLRKKK